MVHVPRSPHVILSPRPERLWPGDARSALDMLPAGHAFTVPEVLFAKIADEQRDEWQDRFKGIRG